MAPVFPLPFIRWFRSRSAGSDCSGWQLHSVRDVPLIMSAGRIGAYVIVLDDVVAVRGD